MSAADAIAPDPAPLPTAQVDRAPAWSPIWLVPLVAVILAAFLAWSAWGRRGPELHVQLEHGHGLKPGDTLRHLGIVVGVVDAVRLSRPGDGVLVVAHLDTDAAHLARSGSRFWVERPRLDLVRVSGLDTLVGDRYLALRPGDGPPQRQFVGLPEPPIADAGRPGLDITLESPSRGGLHPGSPVTYRRLRIGTVLGVGLASDARSVEVHVRVRQPYVDLLREHTRFWEASGLRLDIGLTGVRLHVDTLDALVQGGIALATPPDAGPRVSTGHRFVLHARPESDWLDWQPEVAIGHSLLPPGAAQPEPLRAALTWTSSRFWSGDERHEGWVLALAGGVLGPADLLRPRDDAQAGSTALELAGLRMPLEGEVVELEGGLGWRALTLPAGAAAPWPRARTRPAVEPEDCLVLADPGTAPLTLAPGRFTLRDGSWLVDTALPLDERWHGACVLARSDGRLIGLLLVDDDGARVSPIPRALP